MVSDETPKKARTPLWLASNPLQSPYKTKNTQTATNGNRSRDGEFAPCA